MNGKPLKMNGIRMAQVATGMSPADFPIGSVQSRAIARVVLDQAERMTPRMSQYDEDALAIYRGCQIFLHTGMSPDLDTLKGTTIYQHGEKLDLETGASEEIADQTDGVMRLEEIINNCFERAGKEPLQFPPAAPALRKQVVLSLASKMLFGGLEQAWQRRLPDLVFPIRVSEDTRPQVRRRNGEWEEAGEYGLRHLSGWRLIEEAASRVEEAS